MIRLPVSQQRQFQRWQTARQEFFAQHGREPQLDDLAEQLGLSMTDVHRWHVHASAMLSLNQRAGSIPETTLGETLADPKQTYPRSSALIRGFQLSGS